MTPLERITSQRPLFLLRLPFAFQVFRVSIIARLLPLNLGLKFSVSVFESSNLLLELVDAQ